MVTETTHEDSERSYTEVKQQEKTTPELPTDNISITVGEPTTTDGALKYEVLMMPGSTNKDDERMGPGDSPNSTATTAGTSGSDSGQTPANSPSHLQAKEELVKESGEPLRSYLRAKLGASWGDRPDVYQCTITTWFWLVSWLSTITDVIQKTISRAYKEEETTVYMLGGDTLARSYHVKARIYTIQEPLILDTGCTRTVIPTRRFRELPAEVQGKMIPMSSTAQLADGSTACIRGRVTLEMAIGPAKIQQEFLVADLGQEILLGMDFFQQNNCLIDFSAYRLKIKEWDVAVCDRLGLPLAVHVQNRSACDIPSLSEKLIKARLSREPTDGLGMVETKHNIPGLLVAATVHEPDGPEIWVRVWNTSFQKIQIPAGKIIGLFSPVEEVKAENNKHVPTTNKDGTTFYRMEADQRPELPPHLEEYAEKWCKELSEEETTAVHKLLCKYKELFSTGPLDVGKTNLVKHSINLKPGAKPVKQRPYRHPPVLETEIDRQVKELLDKGMVSESHSPWSSPVLMVRKKDGTYRMCIDFRMVNSLTEPDAFPLPRIDDSLDALGGNTFYSSLDLVQGYHQLEMEEDSKPITAFCTRSGLYQWEVLSFGLATAPGCFERLMERVLHGLHWKTLLVYLDDILVFSPGFETHLERLGEVFSRLQKANLKLKPSKCSLFATEVEYLGHVVNADGIKTDPKKVECIKDWPTPKHKKDVRSFLGTVGYYRRFIPGYSEISRPLTRLTTKDATFSWSEDCEVAFSILRRKLMETPILAYPDYQKSFILDTDASDVGVGAVLSQVHNGEERVVGYFSKMLKTEELKYCVTRKEMLAVIKATKHFRNYLLGKEFLIRTDHASLTWLLRSKVSQGQAGRWLESMSEYIYNIVHRKGLKHSNADGLSRRQCADCTQCKRHFQVAEADTYQESDETVGAPSAEAEFCRLVTTQNKMAGLQLDDPDIKPIYQAMQRNTTLTEEMCKQSSKSTKKLAGLADHLLLLPDGTLVVRLPVRGRRRQLTVCPSSLRGEIVSEKHQQAHLGFNKT